MFGNFHEDLWKSKRQKASSIMLKLKKKKNRERSERNRVWIELCTKPTKIKWKLNLLNTGGREIDVHSQYPYVLRHCWIKKDWTFFSREWDRRFGLWERESLEKLCISENIWICWKQKWNSICFNKQLQEKYFANFCLN